MKTHRPAVAFRPPDQCEAQPAVLAACMQDRRGLARQHPAGERWSLFWRRLVAGISQALPACRWPPGAPNRLYGSRPGWPRRRVACLSAEEARRRATASPTPPLEDWGRFGEFRCPVTVGCRRGRRLVPTGWFDQAANWTRKNKLVSAAHPGRYLRPLSVVE